MMKINHLIIIFFVLIGCHNENSNNSDKIELRNYENLLNLTIKEWKDNNGISKSLLIKIIPTTQDEFNKYYNLSYNKGDKEISEMYNYIENEIYYKGIVLRNNTEIIERIVMLAPFVDGEYAENYFDFLDYIAENHSEIFCVKFKKIAINEKRFKSYFEKYCNNKK